MPADRAPVRILLVTRGLPFHQTGGMEAVAWDLARALAEAGAGVTVLTTRCPALPQRCVREGVAIHCVDAPPGRYSPAWWRASRAAYEAEYAGAVDGVLSVSAGAMALARGRRRGAPGPVFVAQAHGTSWGELASKLRQRRLLPALKAGRNLLAMIEDRRFRAFDAMVAVGPAVARDLRRPPTRWIVGDLPVTTIANGIDAERFGFDPAGRARLRQAFGFAPEDRVVLSASRLHAQKGVADTLAAFAIAARHDARLRYLVAGDGPEEAALRRQAASSGAGQRIVFAGAVERTAMPAILSAADVFAFTTRRVEGLPMNVLEALASGLPVVISRHIGDPRFGAVAIDPADHRGLADTLAAVRTGEDRRSRLAVEFTSASAAQQYLAVFDRLVASRDGASGRPGERGTGR